MSENSDNLKQYLKDINCPMHLNSVNSKTCCSGGSANATLRRWQRNAKGKAHRNSYPSSKAIKPSMFCIVGLFIVGCGERTLLKKESESKVISCCCLHFCKKWGPLVSGGGLTIRPVSCDWESDFFIWLWCKSFGV